MVDDVFGDDLHAKRVLSLSNASLGAIGSGSLAIHAIGACLAQADEMDPKHCIKQVALVWVPLNGRTQSLIGTRLTKKRFPAEQVVLTQKKDMKDPWCIATSRQDLSGADVLAMYAKRWGVETVFRDIKDYRFGMGMKNVRTKSPERRDRLFLVSALAISLLIMLGAAGEAVGLERKIEANTAKKRSYSLWRQGCMYYLAASGDEST